MTLHSEKRSILKEEFGPLELSSTASIFLSHIATVEYSLNILRRCCIIKYNFVKLKMKKKKKKKKKMIL